jgi:rRNA maturation RNase YbeY
MVTGSERFGGKKPVPSLTSRTSAPATPRTLTLRNRQGARRVDLRLLRRIAQELLRQTCPERGYDLAIHLVAAPEITHLNETFLRHQGSTDVITFDYSNPAGPTVRRHPDSPSARRLYTRVAADVSRRYLACAEYAPCENRKAADQVALHGEIFVCLDEAVAQACRFRATWQSELVRYVVHGVLHLLGHDDLAAPARHRMKSAEDALLRRLAQRFDFRQLSP